jgi:hypothetical protein
MTDRGIIMSMESKERLESIVGALEEARQELLDYSPPWMEPGYETMKLAVDRKLRSVQMAMVALDETAKVSTVPPSEIQ